MEHMNTIERRGRGCLPWLGASLASLLGLMLIGYAYESRAEAADEKAYPPPGKLVDVGGYRLHISCTGTGSPTVIIDAGWGDWSTMWAWVQPEVAKTTQVCTYDRAGYGWSEPGPLPRNAAQFAEELHTLLQQAAIPGPYVLVGHSLGGLPVRVFTHEHPTEVAGVVLVESMIPQQFTHSSVTTTSQTASRSPVSTIFPALAQLGVVRLFAGPLGLIPRLPPEAAKAYQSRMALPSYVQAYLDEGQGMPESGTQAGKVISFGDIPLIVLTSRLNTSIAGWQAWQVDLLKLSSRSQQLFAEKSGHGIEIEQPEAAVSAILQMVLQVRQTVNK